MTISNKELFLGFLKIGMMGFGGVALVARHVIVEDRRWMDDRDYAALLGFGQILPGANVTNMAILLGARNGGIIGVVAAIGGLLAAPLLILLVLASAYAQAANHPVVSHAITTMASVSGGLLIGTGFKSARKAKLDKTGFLFLILGFASVVFFHVSIIAVLLCLLPLSILIALSKSEKS